MFEVIGTGAFANVHPGLMRRPEWDDAVSVAVKIVRQTHDKE